MASGTPLLTTKVGGMPEEYYDYFYFFDEENTEGIKRSFEKIINFSDKQLRDNGIAARAFAVKNKSYSYMTSTIVSFLDDSINGDL